MKSENHVRCMIYIVIKPSKTLIIKCIKFRIEFQNPHPFGPPDRECLKSQTVKCTNESDATPPAERIQLQGREQGRYGRG